MPKTTPKLKIAKIPGSDVAGVVWEIPEMDEETAARVTLVEPGQITQEHEDGTTSTYLVEEMPLEVHEGKTVLDYTRAAWKKNGGYPPGQVRIRAEAFPGEPLEDRMAPEPAKWKPTTTLARRKAAVAKHGSAAEKAMVEEEETLERAAFQKILDTRKNNGPG